MRRAELTAFFFSCCCSCSCYYYYYYYYCRLAGLQAVACSWRSSGVDSAAGGGCDGSMTEVDLEDGPHLPSSAMAEETKQSEKVSGGRENGGRVAVTHRAIAPQEASESHLYAFIIVSPTGRV